MVAHQRHPSLKSSHVHHVDISSICPVVHKAKGPATVYQQSNQIMQPLDFERETFPSTHAHEVRVELGRLASTSIDL